MMKIYDDMRMAMIEHNGFKIGFKSKTLATLSLGASLFAGMPVSVLAAPPTISAYYLSGQDEYSGLDNLKKLSDNIASNKASFNTIVISFVHPSLTNYTSGSLACTGLFDYMCEVKDGKQVSNEKVSKEKAISDFTRLKIIIADLKAQGVSTYIAVGGWNFSCNPKIYDKTAGKENACGNEHSAVYDTFPNPMSKGEIPRPKFESTIVGDDAKKAYRNIVQLAYDLGATGIDVDYEEFWHADINAKEWQLIPDSKDVTAKNNIPPAELMRLGHVEPTGKEGNDVYDDSMEKMTTKADNGKDKYSMAMPFTIQKYNAILQAIYNAIDDQPSSAGKLKVSTAGPAVGGIPNMSDNYGTVFDKVSTLGGAWWGGNLYGLIYNTALLYPDTINRLSYVGIMSYDLDKKDCGPERGNIPCDLPGQVNFYYNQYINWLKAGQDATAGAAITATGKPWPAVEMYPQRLNIAPPILVGFEVGAPATGGLPLGKQELTATVDKVIEQHKDGIIMWDLFKDVRYDKGNWHSDWATPHDVLTTVCNKMGLSGDKYSCSSPVPAKATNISEDVKNKSGIASWRGSGEYQCGAQVEYDGKYYIRTNERGRVKDRDSAPHVGMMWKEIKNE
ncbi:toxin [Serratia bockelmannii]|uniref:toxin n=1 Tax=Serratia bockelmannii TaxID=2703793 RepID=UPI002362A281|nr:toxin [Serratia bockelmannii]